MSSAPLATISSKTSSLIVALFDASTTGAWVPSKAAANKAQFTGHPAEILRGLAKGEELTQVDVGASSGVAFELEGKSGQLEVYRLDDKTIALVAPPHAMFADALAPEYLDGETEIELPTGKLAILYMWLDKAGDAPVIDVGAGTHRLTKRELESPSGETLVVMYISRD